MILIYTSLSWVCYRFYLDFRRFESIEFDRKQDGLFMGNYSFTFVWKIWDCIALRSASTKSQPSCTLTPTASACWVAHAFRRPFTRRRLQLGGSGTPWNPMGCGGDEGRSGPSVRSGLWWEVQFQWTSYLFALWLGATIQDSTSYTHLFPWLSIF